MTMIAIPPTTTPPIVCPSWCTVTLEEHIADLPNWDGFVIHWSSDEGGVRHSRFAYPDNTQGDEPPVLFIDAEIGDSTSLDDAEALAHRILACVKEARA